MNRIHKKRFISLILILSGIALASSLILFSLKQNINVFLTPSDVASKHLSNHYYFRLGGMVKNKSVIHDAHDLNIQFVVTDFKHEVKVQYIGILPDLFREGKGVIARGKLNDQGIFIANEILAKHDENYMPKKVSVS